MGNFNSTLADIEIPEANTPLLEYEMKRVIEIHQAFVTLCDSFAICYKEAEQLLNMHEATFVIWDNDSKGLIDALQLFSVLWIYSKGRPEDKVRFLFNLYDFNKEVSKQDAHESNFLSL